MTEAEIYDKFPLAGEYETDARYVWPKRFQALLDENAALKKQIDEIKMQYEGVKLVNIELQSKLNGYKVIYDSLNARYVVALKRNDVLQQQNAAMMAMLERLEWCDSDGEDDNIFCPVCGSMKEHRPHGSNCSLGNLLAECRKEK